MAPHGDVTIRAALRAIVDRSAGQPAAICAALIDYARTCDLPALLVAVAHEFGERLPAPLEAAWAQTIRDAAGDAERADALLRERLDARENPTLAACVTGFIGAALTRRLAAVIDEEVVDYHGGGG